MNELALLLTALALAALLAVRACVRRYRRRDADIERRTREPEAMPHGRREP